MLSCPLGFTLDQQLQFSDEEASTQEAVAGLPFRITYWMLQESPASMPVQNQNRSLCGVLLLTVNECELVLTPGRLVGM